MVNWIAVLYGIVAALVIGLISGLGLPFTDATLPVVGAGLTGLIAGGVAGYFAKEGLASGALHGFLATTLGALIVGTLLVIIGTIAAGLIGLSVAVFFLVWVIATGVPGAVGGAIGGALAPEMEPAEQPMA